MAAAKGAAEKDKDARGAAWRHTGIGLEFAAAIAGLALVGWLIDRWVGTAPLFTLIGAGMGILGGGYNFIRQALAMNRSAAEDYRKRSAERQARSGLGKAAGPSSPASEKTHRDSFSREVGPTADAFDAAGDIDDDRSAAS